MFTGKGKKSYVRSMVIYFTIGLILLGALIGGLGFWYYRQPQFFSLIISLILSFSALFIYFVVFRAIFLNMHSGYDIDGEFFIMKDGYPNPKEIIIKISEIDKVSISKTKSLFFKGLGNVKIVLSKKTYKLKNIKYSVAQEIYNKLEARNEI